MTRAKNILEVYYDLKEEEEGKAGKYAAMGATIGTLGYLAHKRRMAKEHGVDTHAVKKSAGNLLRKAATHATKGFETPAAQNIKDVMSYLKKH